MATRTRNYNMVKPDGTDFVSIDDLNDNFDVIDARMKANADGVTQVAHQLAERSLRVHHLEPHLLVLVNDVQEKVFHFYCCSSILINTRTG